MTAVAAAGPGYRIEDGIAAIVARVVIERPSPLQGGRPEIVRIACDRVAGRIADRAIDAFDAGAGLDALRIVRRNGGKLVVASCRRVVDGFRLHPFVEERVHVGDKVLDHRQVAKRGDMQLAIARHALDMRAAGPAGLVIHHHRARAAHAHPAGEPVGQAGVGLLLDPGDDIENGLAFLPRHVETLLAAAGAVAAPDIDGERSVCVIGPVTGGPRALFVRHEMVSVLPLVASGYYSNGSRAAGERPKSPRRTGF